jgi:hypothetical protein
MWQRQEVQKVLHRQAADGRYAALKTRFRTVTLGNGDREMKTIGCLLVTLVGVAAYGVEQPPKPPELKVLERSVGTWDCEVITKPAIWTPKEQRENLVEVNKLVLDGWYLQGSSQTRDGKPQALLMNTYDPAQKQYRVWKFAAGGVPQEYIGQWDEPTSTLTIGAKNEGIMLKATFHLIDADHREYHVRATDDSGNVYLDIQGMATRRK